MYLDPSLKPRGRRKSSPRRMVLWLVLILVGLFFLSQRESVTKPFVPTPTPTPGAFIYAQQGAELYKQGKLYEAIDYYRYAARLEPNDAAHRISLSRLLILTEDPEGALEQAERAVELSSESPRALAVLCQALDWNGRIDEAIETCQQAIELDPNYAEAHAYLAEAYADSLLNGNYIVGWQEVVREAEKAVELAPTSVDVYRNLGYVWNVQGYYELSNDYYQKALETHPNLSYLYVQIAVNHRALISYHTNRAEWTAAESSYQAAVANLEKAIEVDNKNMRAYLEFGILYRGNDELTKAEAKLEQALEVDSTDARVWGQLGYTRFGRRNYEGAEEALTKALELGNDRIETFYTLGLALYYQERCEESMPFFNQALAIDPENYNALEGIRLCLQADAEEGESP